MRIRTYLILMSVAILVPIIAFSTVALSMLQDAQRSAVLGGLKQTAQRLSLMVDRELYSAEAALLVLASSPSLEQDDLIGFYSQARAASRPGTSSVLLVNRQGAQLLNTRAPAGTALPPASTVKRILQVMDSGKTVVSGLITSPIDGRLVTTVNVHVPIDNGQRYMLATAFDSSYFTQLISRAEVPPGWTVALIDKDGRFIARNLNPEKMVGQPARPELVAAARAGEQGQIRHRTLEETEVYDVFTHSTLSGWTIAVAAPVAGVEASARNAALVAGTGMLAAIALCACIAALFGDRHVKSIKAAARAATDLGAGKPPAYIESPVTEVNELHTALHAAGLQLLQAQQYRRQTEAERSALLESEQHARQAAEDQNRAKDQFLAMLGHELRNPLAPISTAAQLLRMPGLDEQRTHHASDVILRQIGHMNSLLGDLLDVSRVTRDLVTIERQPVDMRAVVDAAVEQVQALLSAKRHHLAIELGDQPMWVSGDQTRLIQVLANLLNNAAKYTQPNGSLALRAAVADGQVRLQVSDNGAGIGPDLLPRLFDLFSQGERSPDRAQGGLGLGLALVRKLVELHGGSVVAQSPGLGLGSSFTVTLDALEAPQAAAPDDGQIQQKVHGPLRVTVVDDNADAADSLQQFISAAGGHRVSIHYDAVSALAEAVRSPPHAFILDIGLPGMDGYELARRLRLIPQTSKALLIALTGYGQPQDKADAMAAGFDYHLSKPADAQQILALLARAQA